MTKLAIVVMTTLFSTAAMANEFDFLKNTQVRLQTASHNWDIDVACRRDIKQDTQVIVRTPPKEIRLDGRITIEQSKKRQSCRVRQLVVKLN
jgi:hypothetical protein